MLCAAASLLFAGVAFGASGYTWSGAGSSSDAKWSNPSNWAGDAAPSGSVNSLVFPPLTQAACTSSSTTESCYTSTDDVSGIATNQLQVDDADDYSIGGDSLTLGGGGLSAVQPTTEPGGVSFLNLPITLSATQTWTLSGTGSDGTHGQLDAGPLSGTSADLTLDLNGGNIYLSGDNEVGDVTVDGNGSGGLLGLDGSSSQKLNATDGNSLTIDGIELDVANTAVGTIRSIDSTVTSGPSSDDPGIFSTHGASFDSASTLGLELASAQTGDTAGTDFAQLSSTGNISLGGAQLNLFASNDIYLDGCPTLAAGQVDPIITTTATLSGTFANMPNGTTFSVCGATWRLNYNETSSPETVTATTLTGNSTFTWTGGQAGTSPGDWSIGANWGGTAPSGAVGTLDFPALTSAACTAESATASCYQSNNDLSGLSADAISIDDGSPYDITGSAITLGAGGLTAAPSASSPGGFTQFDVPLTLNAPQTWSITGDSGLDVQATVSGTAEPLNVTFADGASLSLDSDDEVGAITATGSGEIALSNNSLNGTDGNPVSTNDGAALSAEFPGASVGPFTSTGGSLTVGEGLIPGAQQDGTLAVAGSVTFDSNTSLQMYIDKAGTTPSTDYSQLTATGKIALGSAQLDLSTFNLLAANAGCPTLHVGDVDTLLTTTGSLTGTFAGIPNGTTIPLASIPESKSCAVHQPTVTINYTANAVTATIASTGNNGTPTTTGLSGSPSNPVTNQSVTLTATVSANSGTPSGSVEFQNNGTTIVGCGSQPLALSGSSYTASCQTAFTTASSPETLTAVFSPANGSGLVSSTSPTKYLTVKQDSTATTLAVSSDTPAIGATVTYTATVAPGHSGATGPSGSVEFLDGGAAITKCSSQALTAGASSATAICELNYSAAGSHSISAKYQADTNFSGSTSTAQTVTVQTATIRTPDATATSVACSPASVTVGGATSCQATVTDTASSGATTPSGTVSFTSFPSSGSFGSSGSCTLSGTGTTGVASCQLTFTPSTATGYTITGSYDGDSGHNTSSGQSASVTATAQPLGAGRASVSHVRVNGNTASVLVSCSRGGSCTITLTISVVETLRHGKATAVAASTKATRKTVVIGSKVVTVAAGKSETFKLTLNSTGKRLLAKHNPLKAKLVATASGKTVDSSTITFKTRKQTKKKKG